MCENVLHVVLQGWAARPFKQKCQLGEVIQMTKPRIAPNQTSSLGIKPNTMMITKAKINGPA
eukprot:557865-Amphidinium_carterae.1